MEGNWGEKIRVLITKKLVELGVYVDEELPDYIMVMVANKKNIVHMSDDLALFLGTHTQHFTNWLNGILESVPFSISCDPQEKKGEESPSLSGVKPEDVAEEEEEETFAYKEDAADEEEDDFFADELKESDVAKESVVVTTKTAVPPLLPKRELEGARVAVKVRPMMVSSGGRRQADDEEYDPRNPAVASVVRISRRKSATLPMQRVALPPALQANKLLLLKAVDEANKSIKSKPARSFSTVGAVLPYSPTPIRCLRTEALHSKQQLLLRKRVPDETLEEEEFLEADEEETLMTIGPISLAIQEEPDLRLLLEARPKPITAQLRGIKRKPIDLVTARPSEEEGRPKFVVTLDGVDPTFVRSVVRSAKRKKKQAPPLVREVDEDEGKSVSGDEGEDSSRKKPSERCRYWPACRNGDSCTRHHPTFPCRSFPKCSFGQRCLYIHPNCRFDGKCVREDCPYTHASKRLLPPHSAAPSSYTSAARGGRAVSTCAVACKYLGKCSKLGCPFLHPKPCRFGDRCHSPDCPFAHPLPSPSSLKWIAPNSGLLL